jgi:acetolactate synthase I/II/III large subunit
MYTTAKAFLEALRDYGVSYIFANLGSDHPAIIEALAEAKATGTPMPRVLTCPNEMVALSAAHGYAQATGQPQAVLVHVECGTQALAGAVHNAAKGRVPVLIFAGLSPVTQEGELRGSRNEFIHWLQDVFDQRGIVRQYMRYDNEIRTGHNVKQIVYRAMQFATSDPRGPVYLTAGREILEQEIPQVSPDRSFWPTLPLGPAPAEFIDALAVELRKARRPLVVTSYLGRNLQAVAELVKLADRIGLGVSESFPNYSNFPVAHAMHQGMTPPLADADLVLVIDSDVPWIQTVSKPRDGVPVFQIDLDPLKEQMPLWQLTARHIARADSAVALKQLNAAVLSGQSDGYWAARHQTWRDGLATKESGSALTAEYLTARIRQHLESDAIVLNEGITNYKAIAEHIERPMFTSGGGSLGWNGGAAIGFKLANPDKTIVALTGDGSFMFSVPSSVHWMARRYQTPFLQVVYNNGGWRAPRLSMLAVHPEGYASRTEDIGVSFEQAPDYGGIAAASGGAFARIVKDARELDTALAQALDAVRIEKRAAVLDVLLA